MSDAELLAILLRVGMQGENAVAVGDRLLKDLGGLVGLYRAEFETVLAQKGIGPAKAAQLKAAIELGRRLTIASPDDCPLVHSPADAANLLLYEMGALEQEELRVILLDIHNRVQSIATVYRGSVNSSQVRVAEIFKLAIRANLPSLIVVHNHPSGDPTPSPRCFRYPGDRPGRQAVGYRCTRSSGHWAWPLGFFERARPGLFVKGFKQ